MDKNIFLTEVFDNFTTKEEKIIFNTFIDEKTKKEYFYTIDFSVNSTKNPFNIKVIDIADGHKVELKFILNYHELICSYKGIKINSYEVEQLLSKYILQDTVAHIDFNFQNTSDYLKIDRDTITQKAKKEFPIVLRDLVGVALNCITEFIDKTMVVDEDYEKFSEFASEFSDLIFQPIIENNIKNKKLCNQNYYINKDSIQNEIIGTNQFEKYQKKILVKKCTELLLDECTKIDNSKFKDMKVLLRIKNENYAFFYEVLIKKIADKIYSNYNLDILQELNSNNDFELKLYNNLQKYINENINALFENKCDLVNKSHRIEELLIESKIIYKLNTKYKRQSKYINFPSTLYLYYIYYAQENEHSNSTKDKLKVILNEYIRGSYKREFFKEIHKNQFAPISFGSGFLENNKNFTNTILGLQTTIYPISAIDVNNSYMSTKFKNTDQVTYIEFNNKNIKCLKKIFGANYPSNNFDNKYNTIPAFELYKNLSIPFNTTNIKFDRYKVSYFQSKFRNINQGAFVPLPMLKSIKLSFQEKKPVFRDVKKVKEAIRFAIMPYIQFMLENTDKDKSDLVKKESIVLITDMIRYKCSIIENDDGIQQSLNSICTSIDEEIKKSFPD